MTQTMQTPALPAVGSGDQPLNLRATFLPLALDIAIPLAIFYGLRNGFGASLVFSLAASSVLPAVRSVFEFARHRKFEGLAVLMLAVNVASLVISVTTGDARLMMAKDSVISSVVGLGILLSVWRGEPLMSAGLKPFLTRGNPVKIQAWDRLRETSARFRSLEKRYSLIWGAALLADCAARVAGAVVLPVPTMVWLSTVMVVSAIVAAVIVSGGAAAEPMEQLIKQDAGQLTATEA
jgi:intracellular septation protein A